MSELALKAFETANPTCLVIADDCRQALKAFENTVDLIVTSPPYADARKNHYDSIHPDDFPGWFITFHEAFWNALKPTGSLVLNIKDKVVNGVRHRYAWRTIEMLSELGWNCIDDYVWHKTNPMPGYWPTRLRDGWEYCFHLAKTKTPFFDQNAVRVPVGDWVKKRLTRLGAKDKARHNSENQSGFGRDLSKWVGQQTVLPSNVIVAALVGKNKGHPAVFPPALPAFFIRLLCPMKGLVADPFAGSGMAGIAALEAGRDCVLIDNNVTYCKIAFNNLQARNHGRDRRIEFMESVEGNASYRKTKGSQCQLMLLREHAAPYDATRVKVQSRMSRQRTRRNNNPSETAKKLRAIT